MNRWGTTLVVATLVTLLTAVVLSLSRPDGVVGDVSTAAVTPDRPATSSTAPVPTTGTTAAEPKATADLAPSSVQGPWPGRPAAATVDGVSVDWCPAVQVEASAAAESTFGADSTAAAACTAVQFVFDERYSRRSLPKASYETGQFDSAVDFIAAGTQATYRDRVAQFIRQPADENAEALGLILFSGEPGDGHRFYGAENTLDGYVDRAAWINPTWSTVKLSLDTSRATPRLVATFTASAAVPVFDDTADADAMLTVPTDASITLRREQDRWVIGGFEITSGDRSFDPLAVNDNR